MPQSILYYPSISIADGAWLRTTALYWDEVCSIVPNGCHDMLSPELLYMQARGQYRPISPYGVLHSDYGDMFVRTVMKRAKELNSTTEKYQKITQQEYAAPEEMMIHSHKMLSFFLHQLIEDGSAVLSDNREWIRMKSRIAEVYMRTLAEYVAKYDSKDVVIGSDSVSNIRNLYRGSKATVNNRVLELKLVNSLPIPALDVGFEALLDFKENHQDDLKSLQVKIRILEDKLRHSESPEELKSILHSFKIEWESELRQAEKMFRGGGVGFALGDMMTFAGAVGGMKSLVEWGTSLANVEIPARAIGTALGMTGLLSVALRHKEYRNRIKEKQQEHGFAYVIAAANNHLLKNIEIV